MSECLTLDFWAIGTSWRIAIFSEFNDILLNDLKDEVDQLIEYYDRTFSRFRPDSLVTKMSKQAGSFKLPSYSADLLDIYNSLYQLTDGLFTPCVGQLLNDAGYDSNYSFRSHKLRKVPEWKAVAKRDKDKLILSEPSLLDFGAAGKGQLIDLIAKLLIKKGIREYAINGGGDIFNNTNRPGYANIALENPLSIDEAIGIAHLEKGSMCGSAGNRRAWADFHHIMNPHLLSSARRILASWVFAETALLADALSTALFLVPASKLLTKFKFEYALINNDLSLENSHLFPAEFFLTERQPA